MKEQYGKEILLAVLKENLPQLQMVISALKEI